MPAKTRKIPLRTCVACRSVRPKRELLRIVRTVDGRVVVDPSGKLSGRGASICPTRECLEKALSSGALARSLQVGLDKEDVGRLREEVSSLLADER